MNSKTDFFGGPFPLFYTDFNGRLLPYFLNAKKLRNNLKMEHFTKLLNSGMNTSNKHLEGNNAYPFGVFCACYMHPITWNLENSIHKKLFFNTIADTYEKLSSNTENLIHFWSGYLKQHHDSTTHEINTRFFKAVLGRENTARICKIRARRNFLKDLLPVLQIEAISYIPNTTSYEPGMDVGVGIFYHLWSRQYCINGQWFRLTLQNNGSSIVVEINNTSALTMIELASFNH
jgi:hypothetical protein